jgi:RNA polymerase sigma factor (sigma-70 family)
MKPSEESRFDPLEDQRLVDRCLSGDAAAWERLVRRHERLVYAVARSYRLADEDLADVFQEVFAALVGGLPRLREPRALVRWLSSTTQRIARSTAFKRRREQAMSAPDVEGLPALASSEPAVGIDLERLEEQAMVRLGLAALPPRCQRLLLALYYEEPAPAYAVIAQRLGVPMGSIGPTRARCFERLKAALEALSSDLSSITERSARTFDPGTGKPGGFRMGSLGESATPPARGGFA